MPQEAHIGFRKASKLLGKCTQPGRLFSKMKQTPDVCSYREIQPGERRGMKFRSLGIIPDKESAHVSGAILARIGDTLRRSVTASIRPGELKSFSTKAAARRPGSLPEAIR
jgi:hypothetical protein